MDAREADEKLTQVLGILDEVQAKAGLSADARYRLTLAKGQVVVAWGEVCDARRCESARRIAGDVATAAGLVALLPAGLWVGHAWGL